MSLSALESMVSLESSRLEAARQTTQNFQSVASTVQQQGLATAQSKSNLALQRIDAVYTKECAEADVRKLERKLARERKAEKLALMTAGLVTAASALGNVWDAGQDIFNARQKPGQIPDYMKSKNIDTSKATFTSSPGPENTGLSKNYVSGPSQGASDNSAETVYGYTRAGNGSTMNFRAATITEYDKVRILGSDYEDLKKKTGKSMLTFAEIQKENPKMAETLMNAKCHDMSDTEAKDFMHNLDKVVPQMSTTNYYKSSSSGPSDGERLAAIYNTGKDIPKDPSAGSKVGEQLAAVKSITDPAEAARRLEVAGSLIQKTDIVNVQGTNYTDLDQIKKDANGTDPVKASQAQKVIESTFKSKIDSDAVFLVETKSTGDKSKPAETLKKSTKEGFSVVDSVTPEQKTKYLGDFPGYDKLSLDDISKKPDGPKAMNALWAGLEKEGKVTSLSPQDAIGAKESSENINNLRPAVEDGLKSAGKLNSKGIGDYVKSAFGVMVNTAKDAVPYFQAYLAAKNRADNTQDELIAAMDKLAAANRKLMALEMQIDAFGGRGA